MFINLKATSSTYHLNCENVLLTSVYVITLYQWHNIDRNLRKCNLCLKNEIGDEFHYAFECPAFDLERSLIVPFMYKNRINSIIYSNVFNSTNLSKLKSLCKFLGIILDFFKRTPG